MDCIKTNSHVTRDKSDEDNGYTLIEILNFQVKQKHEYQFNKKEYCFLKFFSPWKTCNYDGPWSKK
jgi:hypothetical protein